jgi:peptidoglycan/xylan/chitin deacetylase (PgdA/CDA1 family)
MKIIITITLLCLLSCREKQFSNDTTLVKGNYFAGEGHKKHRRDSSSLFGSKKIVLTYDDHPGTNTTKLLNLLKKERVKATFFYNTENLKTRSSVIKKLIREGHILASHHHTHKSAAKYPSRRSFESALTKSILAIEDAYSNAGVDNNGVFFRYPYGAVSNNIDTYGSLQRLGRKLYSDNCLNYVFWDIDTIDWALKDSQKIFVNVKNHLEGGTRYVWSGGRVATKRVSKGLRGGIVLMHDKGRGYAVEATRKIIRWGKANGYQFVALNKVSGYSFSDRYCYR